MGFDPFNGNDPAGFVDHWTTTQELQNSQRFRKSLQSQSFPDFRKISDRRRVGKDDGIVADTPEIPLGSTGFSNFRFSPDFGLATGTPFDLRPSQA
jgi:hypothetical protein